MSFNILNFYITVQYERAGFGYFGRSLQVLAAGEANLQDCIVMLTSRHYRPLAFGNWP
jgi:hypothetical protein